MNGADSNYHYIGMTTQGTTFSDVKASTEAYNFYWVFPFHYGSSGNMVVGGTAKYVYGKARWVLNTPMIMTIQRDSSSELSIYWGEVPYATEYYVYRSTSKTSGFTKVGTVQGDTSFFDTGLQSNRYYYYKVVAVGYRNGIRGTSGFSAVRYERTAKEPQFSAHISNTPGQYSHYGKLYVNNMGTEPLIVGGNAILNFALVYPYDGASYTRGILINPMTLEEIASHEFSAGASGTAYFLLEQERYFSDGASMAFYIVYDGVGYTAAVDDQGNGYYQ